MNLATWLVVTLDPLVLTLRHKEPHTMSSEPLYVAELRFEVVGSLACLFQSNATTGVQCNSTIQAVICSQHILTHLTHPTLMSVSLSRGRYNRMVTL